MTFPIKQGDRLPEYEAVLKVGATTIDLTGATVRFLMRDATTGAAKVAQPATIVGLPTAGRVAYAWLLNDTDTPGMYRAEWEITFGDGRRRTVPPAGYLYVEVTADLD